MYLARPRLNHNESHDNKLIIKIIISSYMREHLRGHMLWKAVAVVLTASAGH